MLTTILADDHILIRQSVRVLLNQLGYQVLGEASDGPEAIRLVEELRPRIAILDLAMPVLNGIDAAREIIRITDGETKVIGLTLYSDQSYVFGALAAGISGYVLKSRAAADLVEAIAEVSAGNMYLSPGISRTVIDTLRGDELQSDKTLSVRERQVLQLVAEGMSTKMIAGTLSISVKTAGSHRNRIMQKLKIHGTAGLVLYAIREGLIQP